MLIIYKIMLLFPPFRVINTLPKNNFEGGFAL
uniref:Uncharacterized protein n=1 Tax=Siphoviridae sp. ct3UN6 TaxID=2827769 RepID=A0A8S5S4Z0_9CAUD|nr:MAG TPA: hypothetical protein [Siphoviridae sp. ct3UN6]